ncbi:hypothetical protein XPA_008984 [Xanthoria parietina]
MSSYREPSTGYSTPTFLNPRSPPPPPPKSRPPPSPSQQHPSSGPPLPPPPPTSTHPNFSEPNTPQTQHQPQHSHPQPPSLSDPWLPEILLDKPTPTLSHLLATPPLLTSLTHQHPSLHPSPLPPHLHQTSTLAQTLKTKHLHLLRLRQATQSRILHLRQLERQWRQKQAEIDRGLEPWGAKNLYQRLVARERESEEWTAVLEESFLDVIDGGGSGGAGAGGGGMKAGEREVGEFLRRYREGRRGVGRRREERARWDEGRVGGWR